MYLSTKKSYLKLVIFLALFLLAHYFIVKNMILLSKDLLYGDYSGEKTTPAPLYGLFRIPNTELFERSKANDRLAGDFAQVYFPSKEFNKLNKNYRYGQFDPWNRSSRYAPFIHYLCAISYCKLDYGPASLVHIYLQLVLFYIAIAFVLFVLNTLKYLPLSLFLVNAGLFLTPVGLSWLERGQFSLYVAISYMFLILGILKKHTLFFLLSALFAFIKLTSFPAIFVILSVYILSSGSIKELKSRVFLTILFFMVIVLLLAVLPTDGYYFLRGLYQQENFIPPQGVSLGKLLPIEYVKLTPFVLIGFGLLYVRKFQNKLDGYLPFYVCVCIMMCLYPTVAYEYNLLTMFCFIPFFMYWVSPSVSLDSFITRKIMKLVYLLFLAIASCLRIFLHPLNVDAIVISVYLFAAVFFLIGPFALPWFVSRLQKNAYVGVQ